MNRRLIASILTLLLVLTLVTPFLTFAAPLTDQPNRVIDNAGLLTTEQIDTLNKRIHVIRGSEQFDIVILTTQSINGQEASYFARDYFVRGGYGFGPDQDGAILLLSMEERDWNIVVYGYGEAAFRDRQLEQLGDDILPLLSAGQYYDAFSRFVSEVGNGVRTAKNAGIKTEDKDKKMLSELATPLLIAVGISFALALLIVLGMKRSMNTIRKKGQAADYVVPGSFHLTNKADLYLYSTTARTKIEKPSSSGGGSSRSSSSSLSGGGRSVGGKF